MEDRVGERMRQEGTGVALSPSRAPNSELNFSHEVLFLSILPPSNSPTHWQPSQWDMGHTCSNRNRDHGTCRNEEDLIPC